jgi:signal transduction histidine kinase
VRLARRLHRRGALLALAATHGYMHGYSDALRDRFRHLRHDLRTPLGTIKSVLALMDDESVPVEARADPSFRAMATRNAKSLDELIGVRLGDVTTLLPTVMGQDVSIRAIVCAVRRELRPEAERRRVTISVEKGGPHGRVDATGLELLLRELLEATLQECEAGEELRVTFDRSAGHATLVISREKGRSASRRLDILQRLSTLAGQIGATITAGERTLVTIRLRSSEVSSTGERAPSTEDASDLPEGQTRHDVRHAHEGHHGQTGTH